MEPGTSLASWSESHTKSEYRRITENLRLKREQTIAPRGRTFRSCIRVGWSVYSPVQTLEPRKTYSSRPTLYEMYEFIPSDSFFGSETVIVSMRPDETYDRRIDGSLCL